jgi:hypothetical protein
MLSLRVGPFELEANHVLNSTPTVDWNAHEKSCPVRRWTIEGFPTPDDPTRTTLYESLITIG